MIESYLKNWFNYTMEDAHHASPITLYQFSTVFLIIFFGGKSDIKAAYRRISLQCTIMFKDMGTYQPKTYLWGSPLSKRILYCLRTLCWLSKQHFALSISSPVLEDLKLWQRIFLPKLHKGLSLNLILYRRPSVIRWSDACPKGLGGYDSLGNACQYKLSDENSIACTHQNNWLEFVAVLISVWIAIVNNTAEKEACFLALSDNLSAIGWLYKANFDGTKNLPLYMETRKYAIS